MTGPAGGPPPVRLREREPAESAAGLEPRVQQLGGRVPVGCQQSGVPTRQARVGQPLGPVPFGRTVRRAEHTELQVGRAVVDGRLAQQGPCQPQRGAAVTDDADDPALAEVGRDGGARQHGVARDHLADPLVLRGSRQGRIPRGVARAHPEMEEVLMAGASLPQPGRGATRPPQGLGGIRGEPVPAVHLLADGPLQLLPELAEALLELPVGGGLLLLGLPSGGQPVARHHHRAEQHEQREARVPVDHDQGPGHHERHHQGDDVEGPATRALRRRLGWSDAAGTAGQSPSGWSVEGHLPGRTDPVQHRRPVVGIGSVDARDHRAEAAQPATGISVAA